MDAVPNPAAPVGRHRVRNALALGGAALCGALMALQSRLNGQLGAELEDGYTAALVSFGSGLVVMSVLLASSPRGRQGVGRVLEAVRTGGLRRWMLVGGAAGAVFVLSQGLVATLLGVALFTVAYVAGQTVSGLVVDLVGLGPSGRHAVTVPRVAGAALTVVAVAVAVSGGIDAGVAWWALLLPLGSGLLSSWQAAVNGRVRVAAGSAITATFNNFLVGTAVLAVAALVHVLAAGPPSEWPDEPWLYLGGAVGCIFIAGATILVRATGVLLFTLANVAGQLVAAIVLDAVLPGAHPSVGPATIAGTALALVAVAVGGLDGMRARRAARAAGAAPGVSPER
ncbi:DMT family transporter [Agromyces seonyuensis]|uniref:EamA-like transporter family protein n=1 Tax=Agromyces seonyuensis TaxID=2662446 RepID=A0A6I4NZ59_9MICO|nr:DMT family transporter [Agromyces seonyuensis]MWB97725.1 EamA-like transporter family protein [Agromyces seonyuensis]